MALRAVLDTLDGLDPAIAAEYTEKDGKFILDLVEETVRVHPHVLALKNAKDRETNEKNRLKRELETSTTKLSAFPEDFSRDEWDRLVAEEDERKKNPNNHSQQMEGQRNLYEGKLTNQKNEFENKLRDKDKAINDLDTEIRVMRREQVLDQALTDVGVEQKALPAVKALLGPKIIVERDPDSKEFTSFVKTDMGDLPVSQFVTNWAESDAGKFFVAKPTGGDAGGGKGTPAAAKNNPWIVPQGGKANLTHQQEMIMKDPNKARQLAVAAGVTPNW